MSFGVFADNIMVHYFERSTWSYDSPNAYNLQMVTSTKERSPLSYREEVEFRAQVDSSWGMHTNRQGKHNKLLFWYIPYQAPLPLPCLMYVIDSTCLAPFLPADVRLELAWAERCIVSLKISHLSYSRALLIPLSRQQINQTGSNGWREGLCRLTRP